MVKASQKLGIDVKIIELIYKSYWKFIKEKIHKLNFENVSEEEFQELTTNFNIPYIGKLYTNYDKIEKYKRKVKYLEDNDKIKRNQTSV